LIIDLFIRPALFLAAEQAEATGFWQNAAIWRVINLLVFVIFIIYILRNKVRVGQVFNNRAASIVKELEQAKHDKQESEQRLAELEARLGKLDQEIAEIREQAERESEREAERIRQIAAADAEKIKQTAQREIEGALKAATGQLRAFVADQSVALAEGIIRREIRTDDNSRMVNKFIDELSEVSK
jgi:F-type H+-transporting ATPase subunit b